MRFILDTNVLISHVLAPDSLPAQAVRRAFRSGAVLTSDALLLELGVTLSRAKFDGYVSRDKRQEFLRQFKSLADPVAIIQRVHACRDPDDNHILEAAVNGRADYIISGDKDLTILHPFRGITIVNAVDFLSGT